MLVIKQQRSVMQALDQEKIGRFIASKRHAAGLSQIALAEKLGVSNRAISKWECGVGLPDVSLWLLLCQTLDITADELLHGESVIPRSTADITDEEV